MAEQETFSAGQLVFVAGHAFTYSLTRNGSWGFVVDAHDRYVNVNFHHFEHPTANEDCAREEFSIFQNDLHVLPDPPEDPDEVTALVRSLTKLITPVTEEQDDDL